MPTNSRGEAMGQEIDSTCFSDLQRQRFRQRLDDETALLKRRLAEGGFSSRAHVSGTELEAWLVDENLRAAPLNDRFLGRYADDACSAELARFNIEFNTASSPLRGAVFRELQRSFEEILGRARATAQSMGLELVLIGTLPTLREEQLNLDNLSELKRYRALNEQIFAARQGQPIRLDITGRDHLRASHQDVMLEAAATSFQIHWQVPVADAARYYNAALVASAPTLAVSGNSPYVFQKDLWSETRIPLFEQAIQVSGCGLKDRPAPARVDFGRAWLRVSITELFEENRDGFPVLLPMAFDEEPERYAHLRLHNGTIWRWNRPIVGFDPDGQPHLRLEHRPLPAGPSVIDMVANAALFYGLVETLAQQPVAEDGLSFAAARANFYAAARDGLNASFQWFGGYQASAADVTRRVVGEARRGLAALDVDPDDIDTYLAVIEARCVSGQTGAEWQRGFMRRHPGEFAAMTREYLERQKCGRPVHEWGL